MERRSHRDHLQAQTGCQMERWHPRDSRRCGVYLGDDGKAVNPLLVEAYLSNNYVIQQAWTETLEERVGGDATALLADPAEDVVYSGPYTKHFADDTKVVMIRDDNYWGQDASMWG